MNAIEAVREAERALGEARVPSPRVDAELLVAHVRGVARSRLYAGDAPLDEGEVGALGTLVARRRRREPLAYVLGEWGFRRLTLGVDERVLVPRPETEVVVERCLARLAPLASPRVLDVGVGSGAIALALADEHPSARATAVDASPGALAVAAENARRAGLADRVEFVYGDLFEGVNGPFDLVVSNPPYVAADEVEALEPEVRDHEPRAALVGPGVTDAIAAGAREVLAPGGWLVLECGDGQAPGLARTLVGLGYDGVTTTPDLNGIERAVEGRLA